MPKYNYYLKIIDEINIKIMAVYVLGCEFSSSVQHIF